MVIAEGCLAVIIRTTALIIDRLRPVQNNENQGFENLAKDLEEQAKEKRKK